VGGLEAGVLVGDVGSRCDADTANLREGADFNDALLALRPLVGVWRGEGEGHATGGGVWEPAMATG